MSPGDAEDQKSVTRTYEYQELPEVERINNYRPGGFHPVHLNDSFKDGRYTVVQKLGSGVYSTVWLVNDSLLKRYASLKILDAKHSESCAELEVMRHLRQSGENHEHVLELLDDFKLQGPNGIHQCIVTEVMGPNLGCHEIEDLYPSRSPLISWPPEVGKRLAVQIASGVAYLHDHGVVHGDLHLGNLLLYSPSIFSWSSTSDVEKFLGKPYQRKLRLRNSTEPPPGTIHAPKYVVANPNREKLLQLCLGLEPESDSYPSRVHLKICDFGESFISTPDPQVRISHCPNVFRAPEVVFDGVMNLKAEIWALAVLLHYVVSGGPGGVELFPSYHGIKKEVVREMVLILGKLPQLWWDKWAERGEYFDDDGNWIGDDKRFSQGPHIFLGVPDSYMDQEEKAGFERLLRDMVNYVPEQRPDAREVWERISNLWKTSG